MAVATADPLAPCRDTPVLDELPVARLVRHLRLRGAADRVAPGCRKSQAALLGEARGTMSKRRERFCTLGGGLANSRVQLERGREQLALQRAGKINLLGCRD